MVYKYRFLGSYVSCRNSKTTTLSTQWAVWGNRGESRTIATADWTINAWTLQKCYRRNFKKKIKKTFVYHWSYNAELEWCGATWGCGELWNDIFHSINPCSKMVTGLRAGACRFPGSLIKLADCWASISVAIVLDEAGNSFECNSSRHHEVLKTCRRPLWLYVCVLHISFRLLPHISHLVPNACMHTHKSLVFSQQSRVICFQR